jgi:cytochrome P450
MLETLRISSIAPFAVPHQTTDHLKFHGYDIPKGTIIFANTFESHHDPEVWGDPEVFRPERFLSEDGKSTIRHEAFLPFSTGKRVCLGETLARDTLFLFLTCLAQNFEICKEPGAEMPTLDVKFGQLTLTPHPYNVVLKERV